MWGSRDPILEFWDPLISRKRLKIETSNLARRRTAVSSKEQKCKIGSKAVMGGSRDPILEFWDPLISRKRLKLETSNLARRRTAVSSNEKHSKLSQKGSRGSHVTQFWNFVTPNISRAVEARNFIFGTQTDGGDL